MINDLLNKKIDMIFLPNNYPILFSNIEGFEHLEDQTKIIYTKDKNVKNKNISKTDAETYCKNKAAETGKDYYVKEV